MALILGAIAILLPPFDEITSAPSRAADARADRGGDHARLSHRVHAHGHGRALRLARLPRHAIRRTPLAWTLDLMVQRAYAVMYSDVLIAVPLFLFMGYLVERANLIERLFGARAHRARARAGLARRRRPRHLGALRHRHRHRRRGGDADGPARVPGHAEGRLQRAPLRRRHHRRRLPRDPDSALRDAHPLRRDGGRIGGAALRRRILSRASCSPVCTSFM